jgi:single-strand DNA-binding protein
MEKIMITGNLGADVEVKQFDKRVVLNFSVAVRKKEITHWYRCAYWRNAGQDVVKDFLNKGQKVLIEGTPDVRIYQKDGQPVATIDVEVNYLELLGAVDKPAAPSSNGSLSNNGELYPPTINPFF